MLRRRVAHQYTEALLIDLFRPPKPPDIRPEQVSREHRCMDTWGPANGPILTEWERAQNRMMTRRKQNERKREKRRAGTR